MRPQLRRALRKHLSLLTNIPEGGGGIMATRIWYITGQRFSAAEAWAWLEESFRATYPETYAALTESRERKGKPTPSPKARFEALKSANGRCTLCGRSASEHGVALHVDHIKPRSTHAELAADPANLQVLCYDCNIGKGNRDTTDWRATACLASPAQPESAHTAPARPSVVHPAPA
jgi:hypothetical protein